MKCGGRLGSLSAVLFFCGSIAAQDFDLGVGAGAGALDRNKPAGTRRVDWNVYSDFGAMYQTNPTKAEDSSDEQGDTIMRLKLGGQVNHDTRTTRVNIDYNFTHDRWVDDTFDDRNTFQGYGQFEWVPTTWYAAYLKNRRVDTLLDSRAVDTQANRSVRSTTEAGMIFTGRLGAVDSINLEPLYRAVHYQNTGGVDSQRPGVRVFWAHRRSPTDGFTLNGFAERISYDSELVRNDLDRAQAYLSYAAKLNRISYVLEGGYTWVRPEGDAVLDTGETQDNDYSSPLFRAALVYQELNHRFQLRAYHDLTDTSIGLADSSIGGLGYNAGGTGNLQLALVVLTQLGLDYDVKFASDRWNWRIGYRYDDVDVQARATDNLAQLPGLPPDIPSNVISEFIGAQDQTRNLFDTYIMYALTDRITGRLRGQYQFIEYPKPSPINGVKREDARFAASLIFDFRIFKYGFFNTGLRQEFRESNDDLFGGREYTDTGLFVNFRLVYPAPQAGETSFDVGGFGGGFGY